MTMFHKSFEVVRSAVLVVNLPGYLIRLLPAVIYTRFRFSFCGRKSTSTLAYVITQSFGMLAISSWFMTKIKIYLLCQFFRHLGPFTQIIFCIQWSTWTLWLHRQSVFCRRWSFLPWLDARLAHNNVPHQCHQWWCHRDFAVLAVRRWSCWAVMSPPPLRILWRLKKLLPQIR